MQWYSLWYKKKHIRDTLANGDNENSSIVNLVWMAYGWRMPLEAFSSTRFIQYLKCSSKLPQYEAYRSV